MPGGIGANVGAGASTDVATQIAARIAAQVAAHVIGMNGAETRAVVELLRELGAVKDETDELIRCPNGHVFEKALSTCPRCGCEGGVEPSTAELESLDDELEREEDRTAVEDDGATEADITDVPGTVEVITRALIDVGANDAEGLALAIAPSWADTDVPEVAAVVSEAHNGGFSLTVEQAASVLRSFRQATTAVSVRAGAGAVRLTQADSERPEIRIWFEGGRARWEVEDALAGLDDSNRDARIDVYGDPMQTSRCLKLLREQTARLGSLCSVLSERRKEFFLEPDSAKAMSVLQTVPLTQKEVAAAAGIPETALSRWCDYRGRATRKTKAPSAGVSRGRSDRTGVEVSTIHGRVPLAAFFARPARIAPGRTQAAAEEEIQRVLGTGLDESTTREVLEHLRLEHDMPMAPRTLRRHLRALK